MFFKLFKKKKNEEIVKPSSGLHTIQMKVREIVQETNEAITIRFDQPSGGPLKYKSGQFLTLCPVINGKKVRRAYSLCSSPYVDDSPAVTVKRVDGGLVSNFIADNLKVGDSVEVMEPMGNFILEPKQTNKRHIILFGGGSGVTPLMSIMKSVLHAEPDSIVSLVYANRNEQSIIFRDQIAKLTVTFPGRLKVIHILDEASADWEGQTGLLNQAKLKDILARIPDWGVENSAYFTCGPEGMMHNVIEGLQALGIPKEEIFKESFVAGISDPSDTLLDNDSSVENQLTSQEVTVIMDGEEFKFLVEPGKSILQTALDLDIDLPYSCQSGLCTACRGKCLSGKVTVDEMEGLSEKELHEGYVLTCVAHPITPDVVIEIG
jgi:ring-1,2-phenylacetyl-CoA epoxidase subunit PaaE